MKIQVDDESELANSVKLSDSEREILGKSEDEEASESKSAQDKGNSDSDKKETSKEKATDIESDKKLQAKPVE